MPQVLIPCPVTGDLVPTGVQVTTPEDVEPEGNLLIACPECGRDHEWKREDAALHELRRTCTALLIPAR